MSEEVFPRVFFWMEKILDISERIRHKKHKEAIESHHRRVAALQKAVQCSACHLKCAMCGQHLGSPGDCPPMAASDGFTLCEPCRMEYANYLSAREGGAERTFFWHNKEWVKLWSSWVEYQKSIREFRMSHEFRRITSETDT